TCPKNAEIALSKQGRYRTNIGVLGTQIVDVTYFSAPSPHVFIPQLLEPELYRRIKFPDLPERPLGRIGRDLYCGEPGWAELMQTPGWAEFSGMFMSEGFMKQVIKVFANDIR